MRNTIYKCAFWLLGVMATISSCQKDDLPLDGTVVKERLAASENEIKEALQSGTYGYILSPVLTTTNTLVTKSANFVLKFDTAQGQVTMYSSLTRYSTPSTSYYTLSASTGTPLLTFSTNSYISQIYATGDQGITDFFFKVLNVDGDTIKVQPYRKGQIYASEGGPLFNMVKVKPSVGISSGASLDTIFVWMNRLSNGTIQSQKPIKFTSNLSILSYSSDVTADLTADPSLVASFNQKNNTNYEILPEGSYDITKKQTVIPSGVRISKDSFEVTIKNTASLQDNKIYILPVVASAPSPFLKENNVAYLIFKFNNIDPSNAGLTGTTISKTDWSVTSSSINGAGFVAANAIDGSNSTSWMTSGVEIPILNLNMGSAKTVKGFTFYPYASATYMPMTIELYSSTDGASWYHQGTYYSSSTAIGTKTIKFFTPVTSQYFRFRITKVGTSTSLLSGFAEITAYQ